MFQFTKYEKKKKGSGTYYTGIAVSKGQVVITLSMVELMRKPGFVTFDYDKKAHAIMLTSCTAFTPGALKVTKGTGSYRITVTRSEDLMPRGRYFYNPLVSSPSEGRFICLSAIGQVEIDDILGDELTEADMKEHYDETIIPTHRYGNR